jgi:hypothetical protein
MAASVRFVGFLLPNVKENRLDHIGGNGQKGVRRSFGTVEKGVPLNSI